MLKLRKLMPELAAEVVAGRLSLKQAMRQFNERYKQQQSEAAPSTSAEQDAENGGELAPMPFAYVVSIVSILMSIDLIVEFKDTAPGKEQRQRKIAELVREFQSLPGYNASAA